MISNLSKKLYLYTVKKKSFPPEILNYKYTPHSGGEENFLSHMQYLRGKKKIHREIVTFILQ